MKKFYKFKTLAVSAFALMANVAFGQTLKVTSNGNAVSNGDVINLPYELIVEDFPEYGFTDYSAKWDPHLEASTVEETAEVTITMTSVDDTAAFQFCWGGQCQIPEPGKSISKTGTLTTTPSDLEIHKEVSLDSKDDVPSAGGTIKVKIESGSETIEITVNAILENANGVGEKIAESNLPTVYYTLDGIQVENPTKGVYIARKGGKARLIYKK